ncbi:MAG TPA: DUF3168 domain-containing protein [Alphaproteobacteria bacterium]|nr:DUF3168 domain-containing protein [Alphaproteobacteria bacterium]
MIESDLRTFLLADATISGLVGTRIFPVRAPQGGSFPAMTYTPVSGQRFHNTGGGAGLSGPRIQFDCWAEAYSEAKSLADALRERLDGYSGSAGSGTVQGAFFDTERDSFEPDAGVSGLYRVSHDYFVYYEESATPA